MTALRLAMLLDQDAMTDQPARDRHAGFERHAVRPGLGDLQRRLARRQVMQQRRQLAAAKEDQRAGEARVVQGEARLTKSPCRQGVRTNSSSRDSSIGVLASARASKAGSGGGSVAAARPSVAPERAIAVVGDIAIMPGGPAAMPFRCIGQLRAIKTSAASVSSGRRSRVLATMAPEARSGWPFERRSRKSDRSPAPRRRAELLFGATQSLPR